MEEFSFKLLDEGLGFYEQYPVSESSAEDPDIKKSGLLFSLKGLDLPELLDLEDRQSYGKLLSVLERPYLGEKAFSPKERFVEKSEKMPPPFLVKENRKIPADFASDQKNPASVSDTLNKTEEKAPALWLEKKLCFSLKAYLTDMLAVSVLFFPSFVLFIFLTQSDPVGLLRAVGFQTLLVFILFSQVYCLICRLFCFETFGEALAGIRLLRPRSLKQVHPFRLFFRFFLSCVTGGALIPLLSFLCKKDIMAFLTGLYFHKRPPQSEPV